VTDARAVNDQEKAAFGGGATTASANAERDRRAGLPRAPLRGIIAVNVALSHGRTNVMTQ